MSGLQVGDKWEAVDSEGNHGCFWLNEIRGSVQIWKWEATHKDGSGKRFDWTPSKQMAKKQCYSAMYAIFSNGNPKSYSVQFKKVKP